ncbi:MAG: hypothetical protein MHMPM18_003049, partial [Marteilia pararefringens]
MNIWNSITFLIICISISSNHLSQTIMLSECLSKLRSDPNSRFVNDFLLKSLCFGAEQESENNKRIGGIRINTIVHRLPNFSKEKNFLRRFQKFVNQTNGWIVCVKMQDIESSYALKFQRQQIAQNFNKLMPIYLESV